MALLVGERVALKQQSIRRLVLKARFYPKYTFTIVPAWCGCNVIPRRKKRGLICSAGGWRGTGNETKKTPKSQKPPNKKTQPNKQSKNPNQLKKTQTHNRKVDYRNLTLSFITAMLLVRCMKGVFRITCVMGMVCYAVGSWPLPLPVCSLDSGQWIRRAVMEFLMISQGSASVPWILKTQVWYANAKRLGKDLIC